MERSIDFCKTPPTPEICPLSLHDALPIYKQIRKQPRTQAGNRSSAPAILRTGDMLMTDRPHRPRRTRRHPARPISARARNWSTRSEEHTSELQSLTNLVCRLLLEKKKNHL